MNQARRVQSLKILFIFLFCFDALPIEKCNGALDVETTAEAIIYTNPKKHVYWVWGKIGGGDFLGSAQHLLLSYRTSHAIEKALETASSEGITIYEDSWQSESKKGKAWVASISEVETEKVVVDSWDNFSGERTVYRLNTNKNEIGYFYPFRDHRYGSSLFTHIQGREEVIVSKIKEFIGPNLAPHSRPVIADFENSNKITLGGVELKTSIGVLSEEMGTHDLLEHSGPLRGKEVYDALLFSFLFGGEDHTANFRVLKNGGLARIDYEGFLSPPYKPAFAQSWEHRDHLIPRYYTSGILDSIKAFGREELIMVAGDLMTREEIENFLFWRLVIIIHSQEFPDSII